MFSNWLLLVSWRTLLGQHRLNGLPLKATFEIVKLEVCFQHVDHVLSCHG